MSRRYPLTAWTAIQDFRFHATLPGTAAGHGCVTLHDHGEATRHQTSRKEGGRKVPCRLGVLLLRAGHRRAARHSSTASQKLNEHSGHGLVKNVSRSSESSEEQIGGAASSAAFLHCCGRNLSKSSSARACLVPGSGLKHDS